MGANVPHSSPPRQQNTGNLDSELRARLNASKRDLDVMDEDLKAIEQTQKEGMEELKKLGQRIANVHLD